MRTKAEEYQTAVLAERAAWTAVKDRLPTNPGYSPELWNRWREAAARVDQLRRELLSLPERQTP
jgi:hypothetical protein